MVSFKDFDDKRPRVGELIRLDKTLELSLRPDLPLFEPTRRFGILVNSNDVARPEVKELGKVIGEFLGKDIEALPLEWSMMTGATRGSQRAYDMQCLLAGKIALACHSGGLVDALASRTAGDAFVIITSTQSEDLGVNWAEDWITY